MSNTQPLPASSKSRQGAYAFSLISLALLILLSFIIIRTGIELQQIRTYNVLIQALNVGDAERSKEAVSDLLSSKKYQPQSADESSPFSTKTALTDTILELHSIILLLKQGDFQRSLIKFNALLDGRLQGLLVSQDASRYSVKLIKELADQFKSYHQHITELRAEEERIPQLIENNRRIMKQHDEASRSLAMDFGNLFSLPPILELDSDGLSVSYYQGGVLERLPRLKGLDDNLPDLIALKDALSKLDGEVQMRGANMADRFQDELQRFRNELEMSQTNISALRKENSLAERELQRMQTSVYHESQQLLRCLTDLLLEALKPESSRSTVFISKYLKFPLS